MGLYDRDYMRDEPPAYRRARSSTPWSPTIVLLVVLTVFSLTQTTLHLRDNFWMEEYLGLSLAGIQSGRVWQLLTFQFLHGGFLHLLLNGITLYSFGRFLEMELGRRRFLALYFLSGTAGGLLQMMATWLLRQAVDIPVVGASAGISGLLGAFILSHPELRLTLFPIPFKIRARTLLWILLPVSLLGTVFPFGGIAHAAHLGGLLAGGAFIRWTWKSPRRNPEPPFLTQSPAPMETTKAQAATDGFIEREVNPILDKIAQQGIHSLTDRERKVLDEARKRMTKE